MKWIKRKPKIEPGAGDSISVKLGKIRGIKDVRRFLNPTNNEMLDPYLLKNITDVSKRIIKAIDNDEKVVVSVDCDADGITSGAIMYRYLREYGVEVNYVYGERKDGHGIYEQTRLNFIKEEEDLDEEGNITDEVKKRRYELNKENMEKISDADLLIIIDSSANDTGACKTLTEEHGIDIIILDHHDIERENPYVLMVNPQQEGCDYPNTEISGAGVTFKTLQVVEDILGDRGKVDPYNYMDLVAVGMYADMMRVDVLENRYMVMEGLRNIRNTGLTRILKGGRANFSKLDSASIGFIIAPMINGVARMDNIKLAIDILLEDDDEKCKPIRLKMQHLNQERREIQSRIVNQYRTDIDDSKKALLILDEQSSRGFNGLVAQQLAQEYQRPVLVGRLHNGEASGSFRSYNNFKFRSFLSDFGDRVEAMGHEGAGGFNIAIEHLPELEQYIEDNLPSIKDIEPTVLYDIEIDVDEVESYIPTLEEFNLVAGNGFPKITTRVNGMLVESVDTLGRTKETRKINTFDSVELIRFRVDEEYGSELGFFDTVDAVGELHMNEFYHWGKRELIKTPQVIIESYKQGE